MKRSATAPRPRGERRSRSNPVLLTIAADLLYVWRHPRTFCRVRKQDVEIDELCLRLLALHQPAARDLRLITTALKITVDLERPAEIVVPEALTHGFPTGPDMAQVCEGPKRYTVVFQALIPGGRD